MEGLSVIIPVYNCKQFLERCLSSLTAVNEHCSSMLIREIILVDDGSTDGSSVLCDEMAARKSSDACVIRVIHQSNQGVSAARNVGMQAAVGSYLLFVDSDDTVDSEKLAERMQSIPGSSTDMVIFGLSFDYYAGDRIYRQEILLPPVDGMQSNETCRKMLSGLYRTNMLSPLWNKIIRREVIDASGICLQKDMFLYEDLEFSLRVLKKCKTVCFWKDPIYRYRQPPDEGNAGRRLMRIPHIPELVDRIDCALRPLGGGEDILLPLYLVLAREKISCAARQETAVICDDFRIWIDRHNLKDEIAGNSQAMLLYNRRVGRLLFRREKSKLRHRLANRVKRAIGDFRKW